MNSNNSTWHKDIVLEELGNITKATRISQKVNTSIMDAESIAEASLLFVANAYSSDGTRYLVPNEEDSSIADEWVTDLFVFNLETPYDDYLHGEEGDDGKRLFQCAVRSP